MSERKEIKEISFKKSLELIEKNSTYKDKERFGLVSCGEKCRLFLPLRISVDPPHLE